MSKKLVILEKKRQFNKNCIVKSCDYNEPAGFVSIPSNESRRKKFSEALGFEVGPNDRLCRRHFLPSDFGPKWGLKRTAIPTQNLVRFSPLLTVCKIIKQVSFHCFLKIMAGETKESVILCLLSSYRVEISL